MLDALVRNNPVDVDLMVGNQAIGKIRDEPRNRVPFVARIRGGDNAHTRPLVHSSLSSWSAPTRSR